MVLSRRKLIISTVAAVTVAGIGLGTGQALASTRHGGFHRHSWWGHSGRPGGPSASARPPATITQPPATATQPPAASSPAAPPVTPSASGGTVRPSTTPSAPGGTVTPSGTANEAAAVAAVLAQINELRAANGAGPLKLSAGLDAGARAHTLLMINGGGFSHQCPGEASLGDRISAQGVKWRALGENISKGGRVADTADAITQATKGQTLGMYNETPPNDGHRKNLLNTGYANIGISIIRDSSGTVWMTQDFSN